MAEEYQYPAIGFYFSTVINGAQCSFQEVSGLSAVLGIEKEETAGGNVFKYRVPATPKFSNIVLKRGITTDIAKLSKNLLGNFNTPLTVEDITLTLYNETGKAAMSWTIYKAYVVKLSTAPAIDAINEAAIETLEIAYSYFKVN
jgi:phage tail-like protein